MEIIADSCVKKDLRSFFDWSTDMLEEEDQLKNEVENINGYFPLDDDELEEKDGSIAGLDSLYWHYQLMS